MCMSIYTIIVTLPAWRNALMNSLHLQNSVSSYKKYSIENVEIHLYDYHDTSRMVWQFLCDVILHWIHSTYETLYFLVRSIHFKICRSICTIIVTLLSWYAAPMNSFHLQNLLPSYKKKFTSKGLDPFILLSWCFSCSMVIFRWCDAPMNSLHLQNFVPSYKEYALKIKIKKLKINNEIYNYINNISFNNKFSLIYYLYLFIFIFKTLLEFE